MNKIKGFIETIEQEQKVGQTGTHKQDFILNASFTPGKRNPVKMTIFGDDKAGFLLNATVGDEVEVHYAVRGTEYKKADGSIMYFVELQPFRISKITKVAL